jgi:hypothetical protein
MEGGHGQQSDDDLRSRLIEDRGRGDHALGIGALVLSAEGAPSRVSGDRGADERPVGTDGRRVLIAAAG